MKKKKIKVAGQPKIDLKSYGEGKDLNYTIEIDELPTIKLKSLENIKFDDYEISVTENEKNKKIEEIAKNQENFKDKDESEVAKNGDLVAFDYFASIDNKNFEGGEGKNTQIVLGKDLFLKGFDKQLLGVKKNQDKEVIAVLPENYPKKEFANKSAIFKCKILNVKRPELTKINDEFAKSLGAKDLNDLKLLVTKQIQNQYKMSLDMKLKNNLLDQVETLHNISLPENLIQQEMNLMTQGMKKEDIEKNKKETERMVKKRVKLGLILNEIGEINNLKVEEYEIKNEIQKQVQSMPGQQKQVLEYYQKNPSAAASLRGSIYEDKIIDLIKNKSKKSKKIISLKAAEELLKEESKTEKITKSKSPTKEIKKKVKKTVKKNK